MKRKSVLTLNSILIIALALMIGYTPTQASAPSRPRLAPSDSLDWYDGDWTYRVPVDILSPCVVEEIDYQVHITLDSSFEFGHALSDGSDIRVTDSDGVTLIPFWIEQWDSGTQAASIWIKVPVIPNDGTTVYIYYGNPTPPAIPTPDPVETPPIGPWVKAAGNPIIPAGDPGDDGISLLAENMVYDDVTEHYWLVFADYSQGGVGLAWSDNPIDPDSWTYATRPVTSGNAPHLIYHVGTWYLFYSLLPNIMVATASAVDGPYTIDPTPILTVSEPWEAYRVDEPFVFQRNDGTWILIYMGDEGSTTELIGYAEASAITGPYTKHASNPVIDFGPPGSIDAGTVADPWVVEFYGTYYIGYTVSPTKSSPWRTSYVTTDDWVTFTKSNEIILDLGASGEWDAVNAFRGAVTRFGDTYFFPYTGDSYQMGIATQDVWQVPPMINTPDAVFPFFDDFNDGNFDTDKWVIDYGTSGQLNESGGNLTLTGTEDYSKIYGNTSIGMDHIVEAYAQHPTAGTIGLISEVGLARHGFEDTVRLADYFHSTGTGTQYWERQAKTSATTGDPWIFMAQEADAEWHVLRTYRLSPDVAGFQIDDTPAETDSADVPTNALPAFLMSFGSGNQFVVDWIRIRQFCGSEPSVTVRDEESDSDGDGVPDNLDNCPNTPNPLQEDADEDDVGDACEAPIADDQAVSTDEDVPLDITLTASDDDFPLTYFVVDEPNHGTLGGIAPSLTYTPTQHYNGGDFFTFRASDGDFESNLATVDITINSIPDPPIADNDAISVEEGGTATELDPSGSSVLDNDTDPDSTLTAILDDDAIFGDLTLNSNGTFSYEHDGSETTSDSFTYIASDGVFTDTARVDITITPVNDAPTAVDDSVTVEDGGTVTVLDSGEDSVLVNDTDPDATEPLTATVDIDVSNGSLTLNEDGTFSYTHNGTATDTDYFTYIASDGVLTDTARVDITITFINDPPVAADDSVSVDEGGTATLLDSGEDSVLANDTDPDAGTILTATLDLDVSHGTLSFFEDGTFSYTHDDSQTTHDSFTYIVSDGIYTDTALVEIFITPINDPPVADDDAISVEEGGTAADLDSGENTVLANDIDPDSTLTASLDTDVTHGTLNLASDGTFTYEHDGTETFTDSFTYIASDGVLTDTATVDITITPVNDAPVANDDSMTVDEGGIVTELDTGEDSVRANDIDPDSTLTIILDMNVTNGTLTLDDDGEFSYEHNGGETTADTFTYIASDGVLTDTATVEITIVPVNDPPSAIDDSLTVADGGTTTILDTLESSVLANDNDPDSNLIAILDIDVSNGDLTLNEDGTFSYTHDGSATSSDSFTYIASDGVLTDTATVEINITFVNDPPVANNDSITLLEGGTATKLDSTQSSVLANDIDPDAGTLLTATLQYTVTNGSLTLNEDGTFSYTHDGSETTSDSFTYIASDGQLFDTATVNISITPVNDPPEAVDDDYTTAEDIPLILDAPGVINNDSDIENDNLSVIIQNEPAHGSLELYIDGSFTYTPTLNFNGVDTFTYNLSDGYLTASATATITVTAVNDAPEAENDNYNAVMNKTLTVLSPGVLQNDADIENDQLTAILETNVVDGVLNFNTDGSFSYKPPDNFIGKISFSYKTFDGELESNIATVQIDVSGDDIAPEVSWIWPDLNQGEWIEVGTLIFPLEVHATDNVAVDYVLFQKWDPDAGDDGDWVDLGTVSNSPYRLDLDTSTLHEGFNQITALAYDSSGNSSESYIFLKVWRSLVYLPVVRR